MEIRIPEYWQEEEFQPLAETETVYGNRVKIPQRFMALWKEMKEVGREAETLPSVNRMGYMESVTSDLDYLIQRREKTHSDFAKVMLEIYGKDE